MKIFGILCIQAITAQETEVDECMKEENKDLSSNYCRTRGKTLDNDKVSNFIEIEVIRIPSFTMTRSTDTENKKSSSTFSDSATIKSRRGDKNVGKAKRVDTHYF